MMGSRGHKGGGERDYLSPARRWYGCRAGTIAWFKRKFWKRQRREAKAGIYAARGAGDSGKREG